MKRSISLVLAAAAFAAPAWAYVEGEAYAARAGEDHAGFCGMPVLGMYLLALTVAALLSSCALAFGVLGYRSLPRPRPAARMVELLVIALPLGAMALVLAFAFTGD